MFFAFTFLIAISFGYYVNGPSQVEGKKYGRSYLTSPNIPTAEGRRWPSELLAQPARTPRGVPAHVFTPTPEPTATPEPLIFLGAGPAAYYSADYDWGGWYRIYELQVAWGHYGGPPTHDNRWCVHPAIDLVGIPLVLVSGGVAIGCVTGDVVAEHHKAQWQARWGIEVSWTLWNELPDPSYVEVYMLR